VDAQRIPIQAVGEPGLRDVTLWVDGEMVASLNSEPYQAWWVLKLGVHRVWAEAIQENGESIRSEAVSFIVE
jgi:hypothetical protein